MARFIFIALGLLALCGGVFANGDPTIRMSAVELSANPAPRKIVDIQLISEHLTIKPNGLYVSVYVKYLLWNKSNTDYNDIDYAFPIDYVDTTFSPKSLSDLRNYLGQNGKNAAELETAYNDEIQYSLHNGMGWRNEYIKNVGFWDNGRQISFKKATQFGVRPGIFDKDPGDHSLLFPDTARLWHYIQFSVPKHSFKTLEVRYDVMCQYSAPVEFRLDDEYFVGYNKHNYLGRNTNIESQWFTYDLSPAAAWGDGTVGDLFIQIDTTSIPNYEVRFDYHWPYDVAKVYNYQKNSFGYYSHQRNFSFKNAPPMSLLFCDVKDNRNLLRSSSNFDGINELVKNIVPQSNYTISVSGGDKKYPPSNLSDMDLSTALAMHGNGLKDSIIIRFKKPTVISGILLFNGYYKSAQTFEQNSKLKAVEIRNSSNNFLSIDTIFNITINVERWAVEPSYPKDGEPLWDGALRDVMILTLDNGDYDFANKVVTEIRLYPRDVYKGSKYSDLCISELFILQ